MYKLLFKTDFSFNLTLVMSSDCGFNSYYDGSKCTECQVGFYGNNCSKECLVGYYGLRCSQKCECPADECNHIIGCLKDYSQSSQASTKSFKPSFTFSLTLDHSLNLLSTADYELSTSSNNFNVPVLTPSNNSMGSIMIIGTVIGGLIALFLLVIIIQSCVKLRRKKRAKRTSSKTDVGQEEEPYETVEELMNTAAGEISEQQQHSKYYQLKNSNLESTLPYEQMKNQSQYQEIDETCHSMKSPSSSISSMSYLEPNTAKSDSRNYLEVLGSDGTTCIEGSPTCSVNQNVNDPSTQYLDPILDVNLPQLESNGDNSTYLDVTAETFL